MKEQYSNNDNDDNEYEKKDSKKKHNSFAGFILLKDIDFNIERFKYDLKIDWNIIIKDKIEEEYSIVFQCDDMSVAVGFVMGPVPENEAETVAENNYMWKEAPEIVSLHKSHILIMVIGYDKSSLEAGSLFIKICSTWLKQENALALYALRTVFEPKFYIASSGLISEGEFPIFNLLSLSFYGSNKGISVYTYGMKYFGKEEIEILESNRQFVELYDFLFYVASYIIEENIILENEDFLETEKYGKIKTVRSLGVKTDFDSIKIKF